MSRTGTPIMRPYWLEHPEADAFYTNGSAFLFGPDLLVQPKVEETLDPLEITVPPGVWYDYWTGERISQPSPAGPVGAPKKKVPALGELSVLVRGGAILPHAPLVQSTSETPRGPLELRVYPGPDCRGSLYLDDGTTFDYQRGAFLRLALSCAADARDVTVTTAAAEGTYAPWFSSLAFAIHGAPSAPRQVTVSGRSTRDFTYDAKKKLVTITAPYSKSGQTVTVSY